MAALLAALAVCGCQTPERSCDHCKVSGELASRFEAGLGEPRQPGEVAIPSGVELSDGLSEDEAVRLAVWNNAALNETLAQLGVSRAQLLDAGLISDPQFTLFFPLGVKQLEFTAFQAVDAIWLQPIRVRAAGLDLDQVSQSMVQNGLDVIRDVRLAHASLILATDQAKLSREAAKLRQQIAELAGKRLDAGDISELEVTTSQIDAQQAHAAADRARHDVTLARDRLRVLLGMTMGESPEMSIESPEEVQLAALDSGHSTLDSLLSDALVMRPDLRAAEIAIEAAGERAGLARRQFMNLDAVYDANAKGQRGSYESGPGLRMTLPIFNRNQGGIAIADAQWQQTARRYVTVRDQIALEVRTAYIQLHQASENLTAIRLKILPSLRTAEALARRNYEIGGVPYFLVLQTTGQYLDARIRELQLEADVRRATAELDRAVGHRVSLPIAIQQESIIDVPPAPAASIEPATLQPSARIELVPAPREIVRTGWRATNAPQDKRPLRRAGSTNKSQTMREVIQIPLELTRDASGGISAAQVPAGGSPFDGRAARKPNAKKQRRKRNAGRTRSKNSDQDAEHVQVTIDLRLDPRLVPSGVRPANGPSREDGTGDD